MHVDHKESKSKLLASTVYHDHLLPANTNKNTVHTLFFGLMNLVMSYTRGYKNFMTVGKTLIVFKLYFGFLSICNNVCFGVIILKVN